MAPSTGRHDADESASDRARIDYSPARPTARLDPTERAELDELRALLADPTLWSEPPAELEDSVVALIAAEAGATSWSAPSASPDSAAPTAPTATVVSAAAGTSEPPRSAAERSTDRGARHRPPDGAGHFAAARRSVGAKDRPRGSASGGGSPGRSS